MVQAILTSHVFWAVTTEVTEVLEWLSTPFTGYPFQKTEASAKEEVLTSVLESESMSPLAERSQLETLEKLGKAPIENSASRQEEEVMSRLTSNRKAEMRGQGKQGAVHESAQLEHTGSLGSSSKPPLLRYLCNNVLTAFSIKKTLFPYWGFYVLFPLSIITRAVPLFDLHG